MLKALKSTVTTRDLQLQQLQELNDEIMEDEKRFIELWQMSSEVREHQEARVLELAEYSMKNAAKYDTKLRQVEEELVCTKSQLKELQQHSINESVIKMVKFSAELYCLSLHVRHLLFCLHLHAVS